jgi:decaprenylphospho-beta-D-erythro-pentofuranosid-2-ulose 2-reductase
MRALTERIAILGATSSIGRSLANEFASQGARILLAGRDLEHLEATAKDISIRHGAACRAMRFDALAFDTHEAFTHALERAFPGEAPGLDGVVVVYGDMAEQDEAQASFEVAKRMIDVNYASVVSVFERLAPGFEERGTGFLCAVSSVAGDRGRQSNYLYGSTKAALTTFLDGLRIRMAKAGVGVTTVKPGFVDTPLTFGRPGIFLPGTPDGVARDITRAIRRGRRTVYTPAMWRGIMLIIRNIPDFVFRRMSL